MLTKKKKSLQYERVCVCKHKCNCQLIMLAWLAQMSVWMVDTLYLYGPEKENSRYRWPVGVHGSMLHSKTHNTCKHAHRPQGQIYTLSSTLSFFSFHLSFCFISLILKSQLYNYEQRYVELEVIDFILVYQPL